MITVLQELMRLWQIALSRSWKPQGLLFFFQSSVSNIGVAEPQTNLTAHILFPVSVSLKTGDFAGEEWEVLKICSVAELKIKINQDVGGLDSNLFSKVWILNTFLNTINYSKPWKKVLG